MRVGNSERPEIYDARTVYKAAAPAIFLLFQDSNYVAANAS